MDCGHVCAMEDGILRSVFPWEFGGKLQSIQVTRTAVLDNAIHWLWFSILKTFLENLESHSPTFAQPRLPPLNVSSSSWNWWKGETELCATHDERLMKTILEKAIMTAECQTGTFIRSWRLCLISKGRVPTPIETDKPTCLSTTFHTFMFSFIFYAVFDKLWQSLLLCIQLMTIWLDFGKLFFTMH